MSAEIDKAVAHESPLGWSMVWKEYPKRTTQYSTTFARIAVSDESNHSISFALRYPS